MVDNRFAIVAGDHLEALLEEVDASNTKRCTSTNVNHSGSICQPKHIVILKTFHVVSST